MALLGGLIFYGNFYPFDFTLSVDVWARIELWLTAGMLPNSYGDRVSNFLMFIPLGFVIRLACPHLRGWRLARLVAVALFGITLLQLLQIWFPSRVPSIEDVLFNSLGLLLGGIVVNVFLHCARGHSRPEHVLWLLTLASIWLAQQFYPFVPNFRVGHWSRNIEHFWSEPAPLSLIRSSAMWLLFPWLVRELSQMFGRLRWPALAILVPLLLGQFAMRFSALNWSDVLIALAITATFTRAAITPALTSSRAVSILGILAAAGLILAAWPNMAHRGPGRWPLPGFFQVSLWQYSQVMLAQALAWGLLVRLAFASTRKSSVSKRWRWVLAAALALDVVEGLLYQHWPNWTQTLVAVLVLLLGRIYQQMGAACPVARESHHGFGCR